MRLLKVGCGCTLLVVHEADTLAKSIVRLIDYCGGDTDELRIGPERVMNSHVMDFNLAPDKVVELSAAENLALLDRLSKLVSEGYRFRELQRVLRTTVDD